MIRTDADVVRLIMGASAVVVGVLAANGYTDPISVIPLVIGLLAFIESTKGDSQ